MIAQQEREEVEIKYKGKPYKYSFGYWHPDQALDVQVWLVNTFGEPLVQIIVYGIDKGMTKVSQYLDMSDDTLTTLATKALGTLSKGLKSDEIKAMLRMCCGDAETSQTLCNGAKIDYDSHYRGKPLHLMKVFVLSLRFQLSDFFYEYQNVEHITGKVLGTEQPTMDK